jgi:hypothetical protein
VTETPTAAPTIAPTTLKSLCTAANQCWCINNGGDSCNGETCVPHQCMLIDFCNEGYGYWCEGGTPAPSFPPR